MQLVLDNNPEFSSQLKLKRRINRKKKKIVGVPYPFLKWAGGKRQLLNQIDKYIPTNFNKYIEPFVGGGALFFYLLPEKAILIDSNPVLINTYNVIKNNVEDIIKLLKNHENNEKYYYKMRNIDRNDEYNKWTNIQKASRTIFLNRCCYNGLYRVNSKGHFNVPFGRYKKPKFCDKENLKAVNKVLCNVDIILGSFKRCLDFATENTFIYCDPPYMPLSKTANFTSYTKDIFTKDDQIELKKMIDILTNRGCKVMISNSYNDFILGLYKEYTIKKVKAKRAINSNASKRGEIKEVLILNYK